MVMNHQAASSTECPTVKSPWLRWMVALCGPSAAASALAAASSSTMAPPPSAHTVWSS